MSEYVRIVTSHMASHAKKKKKINKIQHTYIKRESPSPCPSPPSSSSSHSQTQMILLCYRVLIKMHAIYLIPDMYVCAYLYITKKRGIKIARGELVLTRNFYDSSVSLLL